MSQLSVQTRLHLRPPFSGKDLPAAEVLPAFILYADTLLSINQIAIVLDRAYNTVHRRISTAIPSVNSLVNP